jgi:hypothetical protein
VIIVSAFEMFLLLWVLLFHSQKHQPFLFFNGIVEYDENLS